MKLNCIKFQLSGRGKYKLMAKSVRPWNHLPGEMAVVLLLQSFTSGLDRNTRDEKYCEKCCKYSSTCGIRGSRAGKRLTLTCFSSIPRCKGALTSGKSTSNKGLFCNEKVRLLRLSGTTMLKGNQIDWVCQLACRLPRLGSIQPLFLLKINS